MGREEICMMIFLTINTWTDIQKKEICFPALCIFLPGGILWRIIQGQFWPDGIFSMGIGVLVSVVSVISGGEIGLGDGLLILAMGSVMKSGNLAGILCFALLLCGICSGFQLLVLKKERKKEIPFAPFLLAGYLGGVFL